MIRSLAALLLALISAPGVAGPPKPQPGVVRVALSTGMGTIMLALDARRAPITTANFLRYVDQHRFDGTVFYRASRARGAPKLGFIQGGIQHSYTRMLLPIAHEPTSRTGIRHVDGTISMARGAPGTAMGDFFITVGAAPEMDARPGRTGDNQGFAAFGHVIGGMDVVRRILASPTDPNARSAAMKGQMLRRPVPIVSARRL